MSTNKRAATITKPSFGDAALAFAAGSQKPQQAVSNEEPALSRRQAPETAPEAGKSLSGQVPVGDVRLTANIRKDLHTKLKVAAAIQGTTIGEILEGLIEAHLASDK